MTKMVQATLVLALGMWTGCAGSRNTVEPPQARPLGGDLPAFSSPEEPTQSQGLPPIEEPNGDLTLREALALALMRNPELAVFSWEVRAQEAQALQAGLRPNPELGLEIENFGGSGELSGFGNSEKTIALSQLVELAGKRGKRQRLAELDRTLAWWDYEARRLDVWTEVTKAFVGVLAAQQRVVLAEDLVQVAEQVLANVSRRVKAGAVSPVEETRARVELSTSRLDLQTVKRTLTAERKRLASFWGSTSPRFDQVAGTLEDIVAAPGLDSLVSHIEQNPDIARWATELQQQEADLALQRALGTPDIELGGGFRWLGEASDYGFILGVGIPIPISDRNQGASRAARYRIAEAKEERRAAAVATSTELAVTYESLAAASEQIRTLEDEILPDAQRALETAQEAYGKGLFRFTDVLDTQRILFELRGRRFDALAIYHQAIADIERLIGEPISAVGGSDVRD